MQFREGGKRENAGEGSKSAFLCWSGERAAESEAATGGMQLCCISSFVTVLRSLESALHSARYLVCHLPADTRFHRLFRCGWKLDRWVKIGAR